MSSCAPTQAEVAHVLRVGLHELCRADSPRFVVDSRKRSTRRAGSDRSRPHPRSRPVPILLQFRWVAIDGQAGARVNEFEQPVFAWQLARRRQVPGADPSVTDPPRARSLPNRP